MDRNDDELLRAALAAVAPAPSSVTASSASSAVAPAPSSCSATTGSSSRSAPAASCSTSSSRPRGLREPARWTAPSCSTARAPASCVRAAPARARLGRSRRRSPAPGTAPPSGSPSRPASRSSRSASRWASSRSTSATCATSSRAPRRPCPVPTRRFQTLERYKARLDEVTGTLSALEIEDLVTIRDVTAVAPAARDGAPHLRPRSRTTSSSSAPTAACSRLQLEELIGGLGQRTASWSSATTCPRPSRASALDEALSQPRVAQLGRAARPRPVPGRRLRRRRRQPRRAVSPRATGYSPRCRGCPPPSSTASSTTSSRCSACSRPASRTSCSSTASARAGPAVREGLSRLAESSILERYLSARSPLSPTSLVPGGRPAAPWFPRRAPRARQRDWYATRPGVTCRGAARTHAARGGVPLRGDVAADPLSRVEPVWREWMKRGRRRRISPPPPRGCGARVGTARLPRRRALRLHEAATVMVEQHDGRCPTTMRSLLALPGVGAYTAAAVSCFALATPRSSSTPTCGGCWPARSRARPAPPDPHPGRVRARSELHACRPRRSQHVERRRHGASAPWSRSLRGPRCEECPVADLCAWNVAGRPAYGGPAREGAGLARHRSTGAGRSSGAARSAHVGCPHPTRGRRRRPTPGHALHRLTSSMGSPRALVASPSPPV